jgi:hypothetical protein
MEIFSIDGEKVMQTRKNQALLVYLGPNETVVTKGKLKDYSAFKFRRKTVLNKVFLNIMKRRRMIELMSGVGGLMLN